MIFCFMASSSDNNSDRQPEEKQNSSVISSRSIFPRLVLRKISLLPWMIPSSVSSRASPAFLDWLLGFCEILIPFVQFSSLVIFLLSVLYYAVWAMLMFDINNRVIYILQQSRKWGEKRKKLIQFKTREGTRVFAWEHEYISGSACTLSSACIAMLVRWGAHSWERLLCSSLYKYFICSTHFGVQYVLFACFSSLISRVFFRCLCLLCLLCRVSFHIRLLETVKNCLINNSN